MCSISRTLCVVLQSMIKLVSFNAKYQDVFRDMGVIDALVWNVQQHAACLKEGTESKPLLYTALICKVVMIQWGRGNNLTV